MAAKKTKKKIRFTQEQIDNIKRYVGLTVLVLALFTLLSIVSYLFTWKVDAGLAKNADFAYLRGNVSKAPQTGCPRAIMCPVAYKDDGFLHPGAR